jgi:flagellar motility protein MotE (MotC chaperone)
MAPTTKAAGTTTNRTVATAPAPSDPYVVRRFEGPRETPAMLEAVARWWRARSAVRAGVPLAEFLACRSYVYLRSAPQGQPDVQGLVRIVDNEIVLAPHDEADATLLASVRDRLATTEGERARMTREAANLAERIAALQARSRSGEARVDESKGGVVEAVAGGDAAVPATMSRIPSDRGRPVLGRAWALAAIYAGAGAAVLCEAWQFMLPWLNLTGVDTSNLSREWNRSPAPILLAAAFGLVVAGGMFALFDQMCGWLRTGAVDEGKTRRQRAFALLAAGATAAFLVAVSCGMAMMREGFGKGSLERQDALAGATAAIDAGGATLWVFVVVTILAPLGVAVLLHHARGIRDSRALVRAEQRAWDADEERKRSGRECLEEVERLEASERAQTERQVAELEQRKRECEELADAHEQTLRETAEGQRRFAEAFARGVAARLHQDRHAFLLQAYKRGARELLAMRDETSGVRLMPAATSSRHEASRR